MICCILSAKYKTHNFSNFATFHQHTVPCHNFVMIYNSEADMALKDVLRVLPFKLLIHGYRKKGWNSVFLVKSISPLVVLQLRLGRAEDRPSEK